MRILAFLLLSFAAATAYALPTVEDVQHAVHRGDYTAAQSMVREVLAAKPDNAKAHYLLAELLAHDGKITEARSQASTARELDPAIHFTTPEKFRQFETQLGLTPKSNPSAARSDSRPARSADSSGGGVSMFWIVVLLGVGALFFFARRRPVAPPNYGANYPVPPNGMPGGPGYPNYPGNVPQGPGVGSTVAAGLGGIAAGMVAEHLIEKALDNRHHDDAANYTHPSAGGDSLEDRPIDFGNGNDWGGDSGGGDSGGSADSGGSFDSGSSGDWS